MRTMIKDKKISFSKLYVAVVLAFFLIVLSMPSVTAVCDTTWTSSSVGPIVNGVVVGFYGFGKSNNCDIEVTESVVTNLREIPSTDFDYLEMNNIFTSYSASPSGSYYSGRALDGGVKYTHDYGATYRAGTYLYGEVRYPTFTLKTSGGAGHKWFDKRYTPDVYMGAQLYKLAEYKDYTDYNSLKSLSSASPEFVSKLLSAPIGDAKRLYVTGIYSSTSSASDTISISESRIGVFYLALAGGHVNRNVEWQDDYSLTVSISGDYISSPTFLDSYEKIRSAFANAGKQSSFDKPEICRIVGQHIYDLGLSVGESGKITCCGKSLWSADIGQTNLQYQCREDSYGKQYWKNVCEDTSLASAAAGSSPAKIAYDKYCLGCDTADLGRCQGDNYAKTCSGTFSCRFKSQQECGELSSYCTWKTVWSDCDLAYDTYSVLDTVKDFYLGGSEQFDSLTPRTPYESFIREGECVRVLLSERCEDLSGTFDDHQCSVFNTDLTACSNAGCTIKDLDNHNAGINSKCSDFTYSMNECNLRPLSGCSWGCRGADGSANPPCTSNADCQAGLQCDLDFLGVGRCHSTDTSCSIGPYTDTRYGTRYTGNSQASQGDWICADGEYKLCGSALIDYTTNFCSVTQARPLFCTSIPPPQSELYIVQPQVVPEHS